MEFVGKVRIKDIAEMAGVSVGTVDRVLHGRKSVSKLALEKVQKVLEEINYVPNHYASALASNKVYRFATILPLHEPDGYWAKVEEGLQEGVHRFGDFKIDYRVFYYDQFNDSTFEDTTTEILAWQPYAVVIGPIFNHRIMAKFVHQLESLNIPYSLLDSYWADFNPVTFYGQDSIRSGAFAARIMLLAAGGAEPNRKKQKIALFKLMGEGRVASRQQLDREKGFRKFIAEHSPDTEIITLNLSVYDVEAARQELKDFLLENIDIRYGLSFNSSIHRVANFLEQYMPEHPRMTLLGYDAIEKNKECLKRGSVDFIIAQRPHKQGLNSFRTLFNSAVLHIAQEKVNYVGIELLTIENVGFYKD